jgi:hypothetical protein
MGVVNTTYTFSGTDTITSAKLNNIIDDTTFTGDAIQGTTLQVVSPGKLAVSAGGITSNELASNAVVTAKIADSNVTTAKIADSNVTQAKLGTNVVGNGPFIYATSSVATSVPTGATPTKITLGTVSTDTNNNFSTANSRFTPTVAGYYQIIGSINAALGLLNATVFIGKNGNVYIPGSAVQGLTFESTGSVILSCNGSTDFIELFAVHNNGSTSSITGRLNACLIRSA